MKPISSEQLLSQLEWRYATKVFDPQKKIPSDIWSALERSLVLTPSSYGLQPWKFLVVSNKEVRERLRAASWNQKQVTDASHYVVLTHRPLVDEAYVDHYLASIASTRNVPIETLAGFRKGILGDIVSGQRSKMLSEWTARQCYIALGNFMTSAALLGVDACPMEGLDPGQYDEILGLNGTGFKTVVACAAGYRDSNDKLANSKKVRFPQSEMIQEI